MSVRAIRLPDRFYLPRTGADGREVRDLMPWDGAASYVSDGEQLGVQYGDGRVEWLGAAASSRVSDGDTVAPTAFAADFAGVNIDALVEGIRSYMDLHPVLKTVWREDFQALDALRRRAPGAGEERRPES